jgi:transmembrane 9 superfamily protein 2/4
MRTHSRGRSARRGPALLGLACLAASPAAGFYLPGVAPKEFDDGERVEVKVNKLTSIRTQLPYDYYSLPFCRPTDVINAAENLGEVLHGSVIKNSPYDIRMSEALFKVLCRKVLTEAEAKAFAEKIKDDYRVHMIMDNLPAATKMYREMADGKVVTMYDRGYALGFVGGSDRAAAAVVNPHAKPGVPYIHNHLRFVVKFHKDESFTGARIVGFEVEPLSVKHQYKGTPPADAKLLTLTTTPVGPDLPPQPVDAAGEEVIFTYDVKWEHSGIRWASRWDLYLYMGDDQVHWFSIINSLAIVLLLTGIVAMIMMRTLRRDLNRCGAGLLLARGAAGPVRRAGRASRQAGRLAGAEGPAPTPERDIALPGPQPPRPSVRATLALTVRSKPSTLWGFAVLNQPVLRSVPKPLPTGSK